MERKRLRSHFRSINFDKFSCLIVSHNQRIFHKFSSQFHISTVFAAIIPRLGPPLDETHFAKFAAFDNILSVSSQICEHSSTSNSRNGVKCKKLNIRNKCGQYWFEFKFGAKITYSTQRMRLPTNLHSDECWLF